MESFNDPDRTQDSAETEERLKLCEALEAGWLDGEGAPIDRTSIALARALLPRILRATLGIARPGVFPNEAGFVQAEWYVGNRSLEMEFLNDTGDQTGIVCSFQDSEKMLLIAQGIDPKNQDALSDLVSMVNRLVNGG